MANLQVGVAGNGTVTVGAGASVHSPASNTLTLGSNNSERLRIDSSGRLLIGTTTEGHANGDELTISKDSGAMGMTLRSGDSSNCHLYFSDATSGDGEYAGYIAYQHSDNSLQMGTNATERVRITSAGYLGINHTPSTRLDVKQDNGVAYDGNAQSIAYNAARFLNTSGHTSGGTYTGFQFNISGDSQNRICSMGMITEASNSKLSSLVLHTDDGGNRTEKLRITGAGNVGVGTVTPDTLLHLAKGSGGAQLKMQRTDAASNDNDYGRIYWESHSGTLTGQISVARQSAENDGYMLFKTAASGSLAERLRITNANAWGIAGANYGTSGQVLTSGGSGAAVSWATASGGPTHYTKFTNEPSQSGNVTLSNWDVFSPGLSPTINTAVSHSSGIFSFPVTGIWECYANVLWSFDGGATEQRLEIHGTTDNGSNWDILTRQYQCWVNTSTTKYQSLPTPHLLLDITNITNCKVKFKVAGGPAGAATAGDDNEWYTGCHFIRWGDT